MPQSVTFNAWQFDPGFVLTPKPPGWTGTNTGSGTPAVTGPSSINLTNTIVSLTVTDFDDDGFLRSNFSDRLTIGSTTYKIMTVYYGDKVTINGQTYELLTMYGNPPTGPNVCITLPVVNGRIVEAFPGFATATEWLHNPNQFDLSFDEIPCFTRGTLISTATGSASVEDLSIGDLVLTKDNGLKPIRWIGSRKLDVVDLRSSPNLRPIRIRAGALGGDSPEQDLIVSPQHRVLVCSRIAQNRFGSHEVLVAAKQLLAIEGIEVAEDVSEVEYWHFMFDAHEVVFSNGAETESLYTGAQALKSVGTKARKEIFAIFPELEHLDVDERPQGARPFLTGPEGRTLAQLHAQKNRALLAQF